MGGALQILQLVMAHYQLSNLQATAFSPPRYSALLNLNLNLNLKLNLFLNISAAFAQNRLFYYLVHLRGICPYYLYCNARLLIVTVIDQNTTTPYYDLEDDYC
jgi:hypothetical protein